MGFENGQEPLTPVAKMQLIVVDKKTFELIKGFRYRALSPLESAVEVPDNLPTDLASVPPPLWGLLASYGRQLRAALMHDHLCAQAKKLKETDPRQAHQDRRRADNLFREAMRDKGDGTDEDIKKRVPWFRSLIFWTGVSFGRYLTFRKVLAALMVLHVLLGLAVVGMAVHAIPSGWFADLLGLGSDATLAHFALAFLVLLLATVLWWRDWLVVFLGLVLAPVVVPVLVITLTAQVLLAVPDFFASFKVDEPKANAGPTLNRLRDNP